MHESSTVAGYFLYTGNQARYKIETLACRAGSVDGAIDPVLWELLSAQGRGVESFHGDFSTALLSGRVTADVLSRYLELEANLLVKLVWGIQGEWEPPCASDLRKKLQNAVPIN